MTLVCQYQPLSVLRSWIKYNKITTSLPAAKCGKVVAVLGALEVTPLCPVNHLQLLGGIPGLLAACGTVFLISRFL